ncbi:hypothetical protein [Thermocatellispora tengchongensis]|uniref:hypothetical protein n=1 Tax=Thermocatellispora tengchongensis TaxID=1073253 RepID=UPI003625ECF3
MDRPARRGGQRRHDRPRVPGRPRPGADLAPLDALIPLGWAAAFCLLAGGRPRAARIVVLPVLLAQVAVMSAWQDAGAALSSVPSAAFTVAWLLMTAVPALALVAGYHRDAPPPSRRWLALLPAGLAFAAAWTLLPGWHPADEAYAVALVGAAAYLHAGALRRRAAPDGAASLALAALGLPVLLASAASVDGRLAAQGDGPYAPYAAAIAVGVTVLLAVAVAALLVTGVRFLARLPAAGPASPAPA